MKILNIEWRNFNGYGNRIQTMDLSDAGMRLLLGENGSGKSTISEIIIFSLYGKLSNKRLGDLPNRFNKNLYTKIEIENYGNHYIIERGVAPNYIKLEVNGVEYDQAGKKNIEEYLVDEVYKIPFYVYNNLIVLSINDFQSFLDMGVSAKRKIIDRIFGLEIINTIRTLVRDELKKIYEISTNLTKEADALAITIGKSEKELNILKKQIESDNKDLKDVLLKNIKNCNTKLNESISKLDEIKRKNKNAETQIKELQEVLNSDKQIKKTINEKRKLYENQKCPFCESDLTTDFHKNLLEDYVKQELETDTNIEATSKSLKALKSLKIKLDDMILNIQTKRAEFTTLLNNYNEKLKELENTKDNTKQTNVVQKIIDDSKVRRINTIKKKDITENKTNFFKILDEIYGENGVKQLALQKILPTLNSEIRKVMAELNMDYKVVFNINFDAELSHLGYEVATQQVSTGERKKIDVAVLMALIRLMKIKFPTINLIFLDEIFSSLDPNSIYHVINILSKTSKELNLNVFVVNHAPLPEELFDYKIEAKKVNNFSSLEISKIS